MNNLIIDVFINYFWETATAFTKVMTPIIVILLVFKIVYDLLLRRN